MYIKMIGRFFSSISSKTSLPTQQGVIIIIIISSSSSRSIIIIIIVIIIANRNLQRIGLLSDEYAFIMPSTLPPFLPWKGKQSVYKQASGYPSTWSVRHIYHDILPNSLIPRRYSYGTYTRTSTISTRTLSSEILSSYSGPSLSITSIHEWGV